MKLAMRELAQLARDAYSDELPDCSHFGVGACQGFIRRAGGGVIVSFRGTDSAEDWLANLDIGRDDVPGVGSVHDGFWQALDGGMSAIRSAWADADLDDWGAPGVLPVVCVGHSLGGALAAIFSAWLAGNVGRRTCAVTFGQPKFLSRFSETTPQSPLWRVIHRYDLVPNVPRIGFAHYGMPIYWRAGAVSRALWHPVAGGIKDHFMSRYMAHIGTHPQDDCVLHYLSEGFVMAPSGHE